MFALFQVRLRRETSNPDNFFRREIRREKGGVFPTLAESGRVIGKIFLIPKTFPTLLGHIFLQSGIGTHSDKNS